VLAGTEVVERITTAARFLGAERDELHRESNRLLPNHCGQLEHHGDSGGVVLCTGRKRHGHYIGLARVEALWFGDHIDGASASYGRTPGVSSGHPYLGPPHVIAKALEAFFDKGGRVSEVTRGRLAGPNV
jgi:hypothetical protein